MAAKFKIVRYSLIGLVVLAAAVVGAWWWMGMAGTSPLERWIGNQIKSIAGAYLNPKVEFDDIDYQRPYTVLLTNFRLTADDPDNPGKTLDVVKVDKLRLELAEIPSKDKPIRIKQLILDHPHINAIAARGDGQFIGFANFVKKKEERGRPPVPAPSGGGGETSGQPEPGQEVRLSDVFQIVLLQIIEGEVDYESRADGQPPMKLDGINSRMDIQKDEQGWYQLALAMDRKPVFEVDGKGRLDLDHIVLALDTLGLNIQLGPSQYEKLPPQLQSLLREHEVTGELKLTASGRLPLGDPTAADLSVNLGMEQCHFVAGEYKGEAQDLKAVAQLKGGHAIVQSLDAQTLRGAVHATADVTLGGDLPGRVYLKADNIRIEDTLRAAGGGQGQAKYKGLVNAEVTLTGPMAQITTQAGGDGWLTLSEGRVTQLPVLAQIGQALAEKVQSVITGRPPGAADSDSADLRFRFAGDKVHFTKILAQAPTYAVTGYGDAWFDSRLNLLLNGGPIEKVATVLASEEGGEKTSSGSPVLDVLGKIGAEGGKIASQVAKEVLAQVYTVVVSGTAGEPKVRVEPFRKIRDWIGSGP
ncbi:MAG: hypothetical protein BIFFINMI_03282 [Phycisphaerae bacterium]|nr:hypothetical protein [Phycisphaerae bacterium]